MPCFYLYIYLYIYTHYNVRKLSSTRRFVLTTVYWGGTEKRAVNPEDCPPVQLTPQLPNNNNKSPLPFLHTLNDFLQHNQITYLKKKKKTDIETNKNKIKTKPFQTIKRSWCLKKSSLREVISVTLSVAWLLVWATLVFQKLLICWDFDTRIFLRFTDNNLKKGRKHPVRGGSLW